MKDKRLAGSAAVMEKSENHKNIQGNTKRRKI